jgi:hypothetical protein
MVQSKCTASYLLVVHYLDNTVSEQYTLLLAVQYVR